MRHVAREGFYGEALDAIETFGYSNRFFTVDDIRDAMAGPPKHFNDWGAVFNAACYQYHLMEATGRLVRSRSKSAKGRNVQVWHSAAFKGYRFYDEELADFVATYGKNSIQGSLL